MGELECFTLRKARERGRKERGAEMPDKSWLQINAEEPLSGRGDHLLYITPRMDIWTSV